MVHFILFYYILSISTGTVALVFSVFAFLKFRNKISIVHLVFQTLLFLFVLNHMVYFYLLKVFPATFNFIKFMNINYIWLFGLLIYIAPELSYLLVGKKVAAIPKMLFLFLAASSLISVVLILLLGLSLNIQEMLIYIYGLIMIGCIIYILALLLKNLTSCSKFTKELTQKIILILVFFLPFFLIDLHFDLFQNKLKIVPKVFNFVALFYIFWNIFTIYYAYKFISKLSEEVDIYNIPEGFFEKYSLNQREREITLLLLQGYTNKEIADKLYISEGTVKNYIYVLFQKLDITNRMHIIKRLIEFLKTEEK